MFSLRPLLPAKVFFYSYPLWIELHAPPPLCRPSKYLNTHMPHHAISFIYVTCPLYDTCHTLLILIKCILIILCGRYPI